MNIIDILEKINFNANELSYFENAYFDRPKHIKVQNLLQIKIHVDKTLPRDIYKKLHDGIVQETQLLLDLTVVAKKCDINVMEVQNYISYLSGFIEGGRIFNYVFSTLEDSQIKLIFNSVHQREKAIILQSELKIALKKCGINYELVFITKNDVIKPKKVITKADMFTKLKIGALVKPIRGIELNAKIYKTEESSIYRRNNSKMMTLYFYLKDDSGYIIAKRFINASDKEKETGKFQEGDYVVARGEVTISNNNEFEFNLIEMFKTTRVDMIVDDAVEKRVELHAHTKRSEMDAVCDTELLITKAFEWGHDAIAITDHLVVQSFPTAQRTVKKLLKANKDRSFKVIYGIEMNMVDPDLKIVTNGDNKSLNRDYVVFDLETTGLSSRYDQIIEFGAVKIKNGYISDKLQFFINPRLKLSTFTTNMTGITQEDVDSGLMIIEAFPKILDFFKDCVLVAQNATFDIGFLNSKFTEYGLGELKNPIIDTLDLARALNKERKRYRLGNIAKIYKVEYDENVAHRADYDADVTAQVFLQMLYIAQDGLKNKETGFERKPCVTLNDLQLLNDSDSFRKVMKKHINILAKNQAGIKDIFKLVSISHTDYLVFAGKANSKKESDEFIAEPRIPREIITHYRQNLLLGSSCLNGEIFDIAAYRTQKELEAAINFYDYIEVQPPENYFQLIDDHKLKDKEHLLLILNNIIETSEKLGKIVVATGDVHYIEIEDKILRDVYIQSQGIGGTIHPLYIYNTNRRLQAKAPDQHFRTTKEMLGCFDFLPIEKAQEIVVKNTKKIAAEIEICYPVKDKLYTPSIEGSDEKLRMLCYKNAHEKYGLNLPNIIEERLQKELSSIIRNGYGVIYYTAYLLVKKSNEDGYLVGSRGSVGSSFVATMANITEVNPLAAHYLCPSCHYSDFNVQVESGYDLEDKECPICHKVMHGEGQDIPFETFLGFAGEKVPDIDLNFSSDYQEKAHAYTKEIFGADKVFRAGTIGTVAEKTAFGYLRGYLESMHIERKLSQAERTYLAKGCEGVKRTSGQHPGGIVVIPKDMDVHDFTPIQFPANNPNSEWKTTHFEFEDIHDNILKLDILGHVDPTAMKLLERITGIDVKTIPMNDIKTMSLFNTNKALNIVNKQFKEKTGALGLPEFGTRFVRGILESTKPKHFSDLLRISGLSHGTDVWNNNAKDLINKGQTLNDVIGCRDDIMIYLMRKGLDSRDAFDIMESVRKGKGLKETWIKKMMDKNVPDWYIDSCKKIKYMFPKAHAVAYVIMAVRVAWFKVYYPLQYYISFFTLRCNAFDIKAMCEGETAINSKIDDIQYRYSNKETKKTVTNKELELVTTLEVTLEMLARGYHINNISLEHSVANEFLIDPNDDKALIPPFVTIDGLGYNVAKSIVDARDERAFISKQDIISRTQLSTTLLNKLDELNVLVNLQDENQLQLF